jgi:predicted transcriptional regulator
MSSVELTPQEADRLQRLAQRLQDDPAYMANRLHLYQQLERLSDETLADRLKTSPPMLARMALCRCPDPDTDQFGMQVRQIATYTHSNAGMLASILRHVAAAAKMKQIPPQKPLPSAGNLPATPFPAGLLAAARDHDDAEANAVDGTDEDNEDSPREE